MVHARMTRITNGSLLSSWSDVVDRPRGESLLTDKAFWQENSERVREAYEGYMKGLNGKGQLHNLSRHMPNLAQTKSSHYFNTQFVRCRCAEVLMSSLCFQMLVVVLIVIDAIYAGLMTDATIRSAVEVYDSSGVQDTFVKSTWMIVVDTLMNSVFMVELLARMLALQQKFFYGPGWQWNFFDFSMVVVSTTELTYLYSIGTSTNYTAALRLLRVVRSLRVIRLLQFLPMLEDLQLMVLAFYSSSFALVAAMVLLLGVILMFAIVFDNSVASYIEHAQQDNAHVDSLKVFFGSLSTTLLTLFMAMSGGIDWWDVVRLLMEVNSMCCVLFVFFVCLTVIAALNIITGVFVNEGLTMARMDEDLRHQMDMRESRAMAARLHNLFQTMEKHSPSEISLEELKAALQREDVCTLFSVLGIEITDPAVFFDLVDQDRNGFVEIDEFVVVCLRLRGRSGMMNMEISIQEITSQTKKVITYTRTIADMVDAVGKRLVKVHQMLNRSEALAIHGPQYWISDCSDASE